MNTENEPSSGSEANPGPTPAEGKPGPGAPPVVVLAGLSAEDLITLNEEIAGMARAGLPLDQGMAALAKEMSGGRLRRVTAEIAADLKSGLTLPEAMQRQAGRVPPFYAGLVSAGIRVGRIGEVLATLTQYTRTTADLRSIVLGALVYPTMVLLLAGTLFGFVFYYLVPQYAEIFNSFKIKLPAITEIMIAISRHPLELAAVPVLIVAGLLVLKMGLSRTRSGQRTWARFVYSIPIVGTLLHSARLAAFTDLLAILIDYGLPLPEAFSLAGAASSDPILADAVGLIREDLGQGLALGESFRRRHLVPELVAWMTAVGEQRGNLGTTLHQVADMYRRQAEMRAALLGNVLPPFLIVITACLMVTLFLFGIMLPLMALMAGLSGGKL